jgi:hypothetical protein
MFQILCYQEHQDFREPDVPDLHTRVRARGVGRRQSFSLWRNCGFPDVPDLHARESIAFAIFLVFQIHARAHKALFGFVSSIRTKHARNARLLARASQEHQDLPQAIVAVGRQTRWKRWKAAAKANQGQRDPLGSPPHRKTAGAPPRAAR